jgi:threonine dehydrogenase-like Zn-dependent dehydrogenase
VKAIVLRDGRPELVERPEPVAAPGEAIVRVRLAGICGTDLEIARGYMDFRGVPGHEFVGVVEEAPQPGWTGRRVVGEIVVACGDCFECEAGRPRHCPRRSVLGILRRDGAFAEKLALPLANLHPVPDTVPDEAAVFVEPLAAAYEVLEQVPEVSRLRSAVLGDGRLGQLCAQVLRRAGSEPVVIGRHREKLRRLERLGFRVLAEKVEPAPREYDLVVEATGSPDGLATALELVRPRGKIVLKSTIAERTPVDLSKLVVDEVTVIGSRCGPFPAALRYLAEEPDALAGMVSARLPLEEADRAFARAQQPDALKVLLEP